MISGLEQFLGDLHYGVRNLAKNSGFTVVKRGALLLLAGIALGLAGSFLTARLLSNQVRNVSPFDPLSFCAVSLILLIAGLQACLWPARRAAHIDPLTALRQE